MTTPSFELGQDHLDLQQWVRRFAADVLRPAASEWDEKEEFPWPVLEEAAKIGLYSLDFFATQSFDEAVPRWPLPASSRPGRRSRSASGCRRCSAPRAT